MRRRRRDGSHCLAPAGRFAYMQRDRYARARGYRRHSDSGSGTPRAESGDRHGFRLRGSFRWLGRCLNNRIGLRFTLLLEKFVNVVPHFLEGASEPFERWRGIREFLAADFIERLQFGHTAFQSLLGLRIKELRGIGE
jgi:hypothetical protein